MIAPASDPAATVLAGAPVDPALPLLGQALDARCAAQALAGLLPPGLRLQQCRVERVKYRPGRNCSVLYRLQLQPADGGPAFDQHVAARLEPAVAHARRAQRQAGRPQLASAAGPGVQALPALGLLTWWWPNDARLQAPAWLAEPARLQALLAPIVQALGGGQLAGHALQLVQYVPEHRLTLRLDLQRRHGGRLHQHTLYGKCSQEPDSASAHALLQALAGASAVQAGRLRVPAPVLWQPQADLHWQTGLPGVPLAGLAGGAHAALLEALGRQLAALHATPLPASRRLDAATLQPLLARTLAVLQALLPERGPMLQALGRWLEAGLGHLQAWPDSSLHGDLHPHNVLVHDGAPALIDLDSLRRGPALLELGAWVADAHYRALLAGSPPDAAPWLPLLQGHARAGGQRPTAAALAWAAAWSLVAQRAGRCVLNLKPGRLALLPALLDLAAHWAAHGLAEAGEVAAASPRRQPSAAAARGRDAAAAAPTRDAAAVAPTRDAVAMACPAAAVNAGAA